MVDEIRAGDCVALNSGGPEMKVLAVADGVAECRWDCFDCDVPAGAAAAMKEYRATFPVVCVRKVASGVGGDRTPSLR